MEGIPVALLSERKRVRTFGTVGSTLNRSVGLLINYSRGMPAASIERGRHWDGQSASYVAVSNISLGATKVV